MNKKQEQENKDYSKAKALYMQKEKEDLFERIEFFASHPKIYMHYTAEAGSKYFEDHEEHFQGVPVMEDGKLQGFNMISRYDCRGENGRMQRGEFTPYLDKNGKQIYMTTDEFYNFYRELKEGNQTPSGSRRMRNENEQIEKIRLNISKLANLRKKLFRKIDSLVKKAGLEKIAKKAGLANLEHKEMITPLKRIEKAVSDKLLGKVKE